MPDEPDPSQPGWAAPTQPSPPQPPAPPPGAPVPPTPGATTQPAPPGWGVPPPPGRPERRRRRRRWPWVLGVMLGSIVVLAIGGTVLFVSKIKPPIDATNDFLAAIEAGDFDAAFDDLCEADQEEFTPEGIETLFGFGGFLDDYNVNPFDVDVDGDRAKVSFDAEGTGGDDYFEITLRKEDGDWRVCLSDDPDFEDLGSGPG